MGRLTDDMLECPAVKSVGIVGVGYVGLPLATAFAEEFIEEELSATPDRTSLPTGVG